MDTTDINEILKILKDFTSFNYYVGEDKNNKIKTIRCKECKRGNFKILIDDNKGEYIELEPVPDRINHIN